MKRKDGCKLSPKSKASPPPHPTPQKIISLQVQDAREHCRCCKERGGSEPSCPAWVLAPFTLPDRIWVAGTAAQQSVPSTPRFCPLCTNACGRGISAQPCGGELTAAQPLRALRRQRWSQPRAQETAQEGEDSRDTAWEGCRIPPAPEGCDPSTCLADPDGRGTSSNPSMRTPECLFSCFVGFPLDEKEKAVHYLAENWNEGWLVDISSVHQQAES